MLLPGGILELGPDASGRNNHDNGLGGGDLFVADPAFLSIAKAVVHSWVAPDRHGNGQVDQAGGLGVQNVVLPDAGGKGVIRLALFFGQHGFSSCWYGLMGK